MRLTLALLMVLALLAANPAVRTESATANDTYFPMQWALPMINAPAAWDVTMGSADVIVAVVDSGVDVTHPDLAGRLVPGMNAVTGTSDVEDPVNHGTHLAGIIGAATNNGIGIAGVAGGAKVMPIKVLASDGSIDGKDVATGMKWAVDHGAKILNSSFGSPEEDLDVKAAVEYVYAKGALIVVAAGNCGADGAECRGLLNPTLYPAAYDHVLSVASVTRSKAHSSFSGSASYVKLSAPGGELPKGQETPEDSGVLSTIPTKIAASGYGYLIGTSQAAPHVAGVAALVWSVNPSLTNAQVEDILVKSAADLGAPGRDPLFGWGLVDAAAAVKAAQATLSGPTLVAPAEGAALQGLGTSLSWQNPAGTVQYHLQVIPFNNDGPAIDLIIGDAIQVGSASYQIREPDFGSAAPSYVMLPDITYSWHVRLGDTIGMPTEADWGPWSPMWTFETANKTSGSIKLELPDGNMVSSLHPTLQWSNSDPTVFYYEIQVSRDFNFGNGISSPFLYWELRHGGLTNPLNSYTVPDAYPVEAGSMYFWRVRPRIQGDGTGVSWSSIFSFRTP